MVGSADSPNNATEGLSLSAAAMMTVRKRELHIKRKKAKKDSLKKIECLMIFLLGEHCNGHIFPGPSNWTPKL